MTRTRQPAAIMTKDNHTASRGAEAVSTGSLDPPAPEAPQAEACSNGAASSSSLRFAIFTHSMVGFSFFFNVVCFTSPLLRFFNFSRIFFLALPLLSLLCTSPAPTLSVYTPSAASATTTRLRLLRDVYIAHVQSFNHRRRAEPFFSSSFPPSSFSHPHAPSHRCYVFHLMMRHDESVHHT